MACSCDRNIVPFNISATVICRHFQLLRCDLMEPICFSFEQVQGLLGKKLHSLPLKHSTPLFKSPVEVETLTHTKPESEWETCPSARLPLRTQHTLSVPINTLVFGAHRNYTGSGCSPVNALSHTGRGGTGGILFFRPTNSRFPPGFRQQTFQELALSWAKT